MSPPIRRARYLVETDPAYADRKTFLSSDYFFRRMQYDPEKLEKRLGDGYYESQIVRGRLMQLKGKPAGETEYKALMDAAVRWAQENKDVRIGMGPHRRPEGCPQRRHRLDGGILRPSA